MRRSRLPALVLCSVAALSSTLLAPVTASAATVDRPRTGFPVRADGTAAGGWFGSRTLARRAVFRIDPTAKPRSGGFRDGVWMAELRGRGPVEVNRWRVRRAAWIVSKYGTYDSDAQAAAVEAALDTLLHGGSYRLAGSATERRLRQSGSRDSIISLARYMLDHSVQMAGPYRVRVTTQSAVLGGRLGVGVEVTTRRTQEPVPHLPVEVRVDGRTLSGETDAAGRVATSAPAGTAGPRPVTVSVGRVPSDRLFVRRPMKARASRVVVAGRKITLTKRSEVAVQAVPRAWVTAPGQRTLTQPVPGTAHLADGYPTRRTATLTLYGPFAPGTKATCDPDLAAATRSLPVAADGQYPVPRVRVSVAGTYRWGIAVPEDTYNIAVSGCGQSVLLKAVPRLSVRSTTRSVPRRHPAYARVSAGALPASFAGRATVRLYGPFASRDRVRCTPKREARLRKVAITGPTTSVRTTAVSLRRAGFYGWRAVLPASGLSTRAATPCRAAGSVVRVK
jgi:hypothetical protein